jgi:KUP system potassium uptake protein
VFGDIGTSPLYAFRESLHPGHGISSEPANILGLLSLISWSLIIVICIKYLIFVLRADYRGEGGILALMALANQAIKGHPRAGNAVLMMGLFGTALLYGDGMITPAISVLSAVEGLELATPVLKPYIIPITIAILIALFAKQSLGTSKVGQVFGPIVACWFLMLAVLGVISIARRPDVLVALNPWYGLKFFLNNGASALWALGSVFLVVTGGEALYADMGHFGRKPIRLTWVLLVFPSLTLNYFGQGALMLADPSAASNPFYKMVPPGFLYPAIALATAATVIASQALISGAYSLAMQSIQMGYLPRFKVQHTSASHFGQIYVPSVNWLLLTGCLGLVLVFQTSSALAAAYGVAVTATMVITTLLLYPLTTHGWGWNRGPALALVCAFLLVDGAFLVANVVKIPDGGWVPLLLAVVIFSVMTTWRMGVHIVGRLMKNQTEPWDDFFAELEREKIARVPGAAVFMGYSPHTVPPSLHRNLEVNRVVHQTVFALTVKTLDTPHLADDQPRVVVTTLREGVYSTRVNFGFMEEIDLPAALAASPEIRQLADPDRLIYFLGHRTVLVSDKPHMSMWRERLFVLLTNNARDAGAFFKVPPERAFQVGVVTEI